MDYSLSINGETHLDINREDVTLYGSGCLVIFIILYKIPAAVPDIQKVLSAEKIRI